MSELGYKVDESEDIKKRKEEWEKGKKHSEIMKKPVEELGYRVDDSEDIRKRKEEWEKGKKDSAISPKTNQEGSGYKVETSGVKDRLNKWNSLKNSGETILPRKEPVTIPGPGSKQVTKEDQTDVKTVSHT